MHEAQVVEGDRAATGEAERGAAVRVRGGLEEGFLLGVAEARGLGPRRLAHEADRR